MKSLLAIMLLACSAVFAAGRPLVLVSKHAPVAAIVLSARADKDEARAATILQDYLFQISGAKLPVITDDGKVTGPVIAVGQSALLPADLRAKLKIGEELPVTDPMRDAFAVAVRGNTLFLAGHRGQSTVFSVYDFLESLGCRWFMPCKAGEVVPQLPTISAAPSETVKVPTFPFRSSYSWDNPGRGEETAQWREANKMVYCSLGPGFQGHNFVEIWPESLYATHPEYFPLVDGKRVQHGQRCLSNPEVIKLGVAWAEKQLAGGNKLVSFSMNDGESGFCQCENCSKIGNFADQYMSMVNAVGKEIFARHPDVMITMMCYFQSARQIHVKADGYDENRDRIIIDVYSNYALEPWQTVLESWGKASHHLLINEAWSWIYWGWGEGLGNPVSYLETDRLKLYPFYAHNNAFGLSTEIMHDWAKNGFTHYVSTRLKWDVKTDIEGLRRDFCAKMFPSATVEFYNYLALYDDFAAGRIDMNGFMKKGCYLLDAVQRKVGTSGRERERWEFYALYLHERTLAQALDAIDPNDKPARIAAIHELVSFLKGIADRGVMDSNNWVNNFYCPLLKSLGEDPGRQNVNNLKETLPNIPPMPVDAQQIDDWFAHDKAQFHTDVPVILRDSF